jgi:glutathione synthase/RimK-type ligase-like ATP-grasp enzyme
MLREVRSAWYRRPTAFLFPEGMSEPERHHAMWEARLGLGGLLADLDVLWVNHPSREADAGYKPVQLAVAARCRLIVPPTLVTNRPDAVRRFADRHGPVVVKPLGFGSIFEDRRIRALYTHELSPAELADLAGVEATAHLFQRAIVDKAFEARVTVVGERIFAAAIHADSLAARADWRSDYESLGLSMVELPPRVEAGVLFSCVPSGLRSEPSTSRSTPPASGGSSSAIAPASSDSSRT